MCQTSYHPLAARIISQRGENHLLYLECRQCGSAVVEFVTADAYGVDSIGILTDLTSEELAVTAGRSDIQPDDVLELHQWFYQHNSIHLTLRREKA